MSLLLSGFVFSALLLLVYRFLAPRWGLIDRPNERSQHVTPTVVGGGIAVVLAVAAQLMLAYEDNGLVLINVPRFVGAILVLGMIGLADDRFHLPSSWRLLVYFGVSATIVASELPSMTPGLWGVVVLGLVWVMNLVNFMDGLDGFALSQALSVAFGMAILSTQGPFDGQGTGLLALILVAALLPLMWFNWPPASMFMGDAGAVFLGFYLGVLGLKAVVVDLRLGAAWLILMMPFLVDATFTLLIRLTAGLPPHIAHRDHAYQRLAGRTGSALPVVLGLLALQGLWQFPLAWWALSGSYSPILAVIFSAIPTGLVLVYLRRSA